MLRAMSASLPDRAPDTAAWAALELRLHALGQVVLRLDNEGIPSLPIKGALLARQLYEEARDRPLIDVDLLIQPRDFPRLLRIARSQKWPLVWDSKQLGNVNLLVDGTAIDIASSLGPPGTSAIGVETLLRRASRATEPLGFPHWQIDLHDHALLVAVDAFKDKLGSKPHSREDLLRIGASPAFAPPRLAEIAREARLETLVAIVSAWVLEEASSPGWQAVRRALGPVRRESYGRFFRYLCKRRAAPLHRIPLALLARSASDSPPRAALALALGGAGTLFFLARNRGFSVKADHVLGARAS